MAICQIKKLKTVKVLGKNLIYLRNNKKISTLVLSKVLIFLDLKCQNKLTILFNSFTRFNEFNCAHIINRRFV